MDCPIKNGHFPWLVKLPEGSGKHHLVLRSPNIENTSTIWRNDDLSCRPSSATLVTVYPPTYGGWLRNPPVDRWFILLFIGFQPSFWWFLDFATIHSMTSFPTYDFIWHTGMTVAVLVNTLFLWIHHPHSQFPQMIIHPLKKIASI